MNKSTQTTNSALLRPSATCPASANDDSILVPKSSKTYSRPFGSTRGRGAIRVPTASVDDERPLLRNNSYNTLRETMVSYVSSPWTKQGLLPRRAASRLRPLTEEKQMANNLLKCATQARTNAQLLSVSSGGIRTLSREDALRARGEILEAIRRLQAFEKELAKKIDAT